MIEIQQLKSAGIVHGFFGRQGGVSTGIFASLNCGLGSGDERDKVVANRAIVAQALGRSEADIITAHQVHSAEATIVKGRVAHDERPKLDGLATNVPGIILGSLTADCGPVLFADAGAGVVGACHAGWKGALHGVTDATVVKMEELGASRANIVAVVGPTISRTAYEVGPEFRDRFPPEASHFFSASTREGHFMFDLPGFLVDRMMCFGVGTVVDSGFCTYGNPERFFSYRRATHRGEPDYGRQIAAIALR